MRALSDLRSAGAVDTAIVYYSGHGTESALHLGRKKFSLRKLRAQLAAFPASMKIAVIDACRSGHRQRKKGWRQGRSVAVSVAPPRGPRGSVELRASSVGEPSRESGDLQGGIFTHYLLSGLRGAADENGDEQVTLAEAYAFAYGHTLSRSARSGDRLQRPDANLNLGGGGPLVLTRTALASAVLSFPPGKDIHYLVFRLPSVTAVAELWAKANRPVSVAVPSGRYLVVRRTGKTRRAGTEVALTFGGRRKLTASAFRPYPREVQTARGGARLVHRRALGARYGFVLSKDGAMGHRLSVGYGLRTGPWTLGGRALLGQITDTEYPLESSSRFVGGEVLGTWHAPLGPTTVGISAGASVQGRRLDIRRLDVDASRAPSSADERRVTYTYLAYGPLAEGRIDLYWGSRVTTTLGLNLTVLMAKERDGMTWTLDSSAWTGVSVAF